MTKVGRPDLGRVAAAAAILFAAWTTFGLLSSAHFAFGYGRTTDIASFSRLADNVVVFYWGWALLTPAVFLLARRLAGDGIRSWRNWAIVVAGSVAVMMVHGLVHTWATWLLGIDRGSGSGPHSLIDYAQRHGGGDLATFGVLVGGYLLFDANRRAAARELAASELSAQLAKADLELLRWNLHPHFVFNALNTVSTLVMKGANEDAGKAISLISRYLRSGMAQRADSMVTLSEDVALVRRYLEIETLRFGDSLKLEVDADPDALEATLPGSILQPLVENAIAHGTVREPGSRPIRIDARIMDERLRVSVSNPSQGEALGSHNGDADTARFGLRYVRERLRQFYGDDARFDLEINAFETTATVDVPRRQA